MLEIDYAWQRGVSLFWGVIHLAILGDNTSASCIKLILIAYPILTSKIGVAASIAVVDCSRHKCS